MRQLWGNIERELLKTIVKCNSIIEPLSNQQGTATTQSSSFSFQINEPCQNVEISSH